MGGSTRIVERLRLRASSESALRQVLPKLEDALRTATLPDGGARLLFVRRLHLGHLPPRASAQSLSLLLESRFAAAERGIVHAGDAAADDAHAVWFRDSLEACALAALRVAAGRSVDAWFWPLAVPALAAATSRAERLRSIAFALAALEEAPAALPVWTASLVRAGYLTPLIAALRPGDGTTLQRAAGMDRPEPDRLIGPAGADARAVARRSGDGTRSTTDAARWAARSCDDLPFAGPDDRIEFIQRMVQRTTGHPIVWAASSAATPIDTESDVRSRDTSHPERSFDLARRSVDVAIPVPMAGAPAAHPHLTQHEPSIDVVARAIQADRAHLDASAPVLSRDRDRHSHPTRDIPRESRAGSGATAPEMATSAQPWAIPGTAPTAAGGLLFLVPVLERLGFGDTRNAAKAFRQTWCTSAGRGHRHLPDACARRILHVLLARLRIDDNDAAWQLATPGDDMDDNPVDDVFEHLISRLDRLAPRHASRRGLPAPRDNSSRRLSRPDWRADRSVSISELWLAGCRRFLRRRAGIGLATLVVRPARLALTATHVDLFFRLSSAERRVRRAGLDVDPGWVPWLAKVVAFHYEDGPWS